MKINPRIAAIVLGSGLLSGCSTYAPDKREINPSAALHRLNPETGLCQNYARGFGQGETYTTIEPCNDRVLALVPQEDKDAAKTKGVKPITWGQEVLIP